MSLHRLPSKKGRPVILLGLLAVVILLMIMVGKCTRPSTEKGNIHPELKKSGGDTLDVAIELSPRIYMPAGDSISGLDYELMSAICRLSGRPVKFHPFAPLDYAIDGLESGLFDVIISSLPSTALLKEKFSLTDEVYRDRQILVQLKDSPRFIGSPENLGGDTVWVAAGSPFTQRIANLGDETGDSITVVELEGRTAEHLVMLVARGEIPRAVVYEGIARRMKKKLYPDIDIETPVSFTQLQSWATSKADTTLRNALNDCLNAFRNTHEYRSILEKYR